VTPGTGDHRLKVNKSDADKTASVIFQDNASGRAEFGLAGDDDFHVKVSPDGSTWKEAIVVDRATGAVAFPFTTLGAVGANLLVNGDFAVNQRAFGGGSLSAGSYGFDRWKAATGGASVTLSGYTVTLASGELEQVVEPSVFGYASFASTAVTVSVDTPSADLTVTFGSQSGTITAGSGRRSVTLTLGAGDTGNLSFKIKKASGSNVTFGRVNLEVGSAATDWAARDLLSQLALCHRYYQPSTASTGNLFNVGFINAAFPLIAPMRATPSVSVVNGASAVDRPGVAAYNVTGISVVFGAGPTGVLVQVTTNGTSLGICSIQPSALAMSAEL